MPQNTDLTIGEYEREPVVIKAGDVAVCDFFLHEEELLQRTGNTARGSIEAYNIRTAELFDIDIEEEVVLVTKLDVMHTTE